MASPRAIAFGPLETIVNVKWAKPGTYHAVFYAESFRQFDPDNDPAPERHLKIVSSTIPGLNAGDLLEQYTPLFPGGDFPTEGTGVIGAMPIFKDTRTDTHTVTTEVIDKAEYHVSTIYGDITFFQRPGIGGEVIVPIFVDFNIPPDSSSGGYVGSGLAEAMAREASLYTFGDEDNAMLKEPPVNIIASHPDTVTTTTQQDRVVQNIFIDLTQLGNDGATIEVTLEMSGAPLGQEGDETMTSAGFIFWTDTEGVVYGAPPAFSVVDDDDVAVPGSPGPSNSNLQPGVMKTTTLRRNLETGEDTVTESFGPMP